MPSKKTQNSLRETTNDYMRREVTYYRFRRVELYQPPPAAGLPLPSAPKPPPIARPPGPYAQTSGPRSSTKERPAHRQCRHSDVQTRERRHNEVRAEPPVPERRHRDPQRGTSTRERHLTDAGPPAQPTKRRRVHFADNLIIHNLSPTPSAPPPQAPRPTDCVSTPPTPVPPPKKAIPAIHLDLVSFLPHHWDLRRNARPPYHPLLDHVRYQPVFPSATSLQTIRLVFAPCTRTELAWFATVSMPPYRKHFAVEDVLGAISTELFKTAGACAELYTDHPCFARAQQARLARLRTGWWDKPVYADPIRNVDLWHLRSRDGRGHGLWFKGLREERLRDGEVVYRVEFDRD